MENLLSLRLWQSLFLVNRESAGLKNNTGNLSPRCWTWCRRNGHKHFPHLISFCFNGLKHQTAPYIKYLCCYGNPVPNDLLWLYQPQTVYNLCRICIAQLRFCGITREWNSHHHGNNSPWPEASSRVQYYSNNLQSELHVVMKKEVSETARWKTGDVSLSTIRHHWCRPLLAIRKYV